MFEQYDGSSVYVQVIPVCVVGVYCVCVCGMGVVYDCFCVIAVVYVCVLMSRTIPKLV